MKQLFDRLRQLSFRTGVIVLLTCIPFYLLVLVQPLLPLSASAKWTVGVTAFILARTFRYAGILIIGKEGLRRIKESWRAWRTRRQRAI